MKICTVQTEAVKRDIQKNIQKHLALISEAVEKGADLIFFPELSLTGYEPTLAEKLVMTVDDLRLDAFQVVSDAKEVVICVGISERGVKGIHISMVIFQPAKERVSYSKRYVHEDELPYFTEGDEQLLLKVKGCVIAPAICYESLMPKHAEDAFEMGAEIYLASVAKPAHAVARAYKHYPEIARKYDMPVVMSNSTGFCDNFLSTGQSGIWGSNGELLAQLNETEEGMLIYDTGTNEVTRLRSSGVDKLRSGGV